ncbi:MAG: pyridoxamine 5'-phosphate oxidase family protein [Pseudomonadota bacterium]
MTETLPDTAHLITTEEDLEAVYGEPVEAALIKEIARLNAPYRRMIESAPFVAVASAGPGGLDCTPRGDPAPVVHFEDDRTLLLPDRRGNNRIDTLRNLVRDDRIALLFLIPGVGNTLRVNGRAAISIEPSLLERFRMQGKAPRSVIIVRVESVYFQCVKALHRSRLWDPSAWPDISALPSAGDMLKATDESLDAAAYDAAYPDRLKRTIY